MRGFGWFVFAADLVESFNSVVVSFLVCGLIPFVWLGGVCYLV